MKKKKDTLSFKNRLFASFAIYGIVLVLIALFAVFRVTQINTQNSSLENANVKFMELKNSFDDYIGLVHLKLYAIRDSKIFQHYIEHKEDKNSFYNTKDLFLDIAKTNPNIMQLRYIDKNGDEIIRVDRTSFSQTPTLIEKDKRQNKANRYYFKDIIKLKNYKIWYSNLDLNIEYGKIEKPINPVLRVGFPIFNAKKEKVGILITNIFMKSFLNKLSNLSLYNAYLIDKDGNFLIHSNAQHNWSKYIDKEVDTYFKKDILKQIIRNDEYISENFYSNCIGLQNSENIKMIVEPKENKINEQIIEQTKDTVIFMSTIVLLSFFVAYWLSLSPNKLKEEVDELNLSLNDKVKKITLQKNILQNIIDAKKSMTVVTDFNEISFANSAFFSFFNVKNIKEFNTKYSNIFDIFLQKKGHIYKNIIEADSTSYAQIGSEFHKLIENSDEEKKLVCIEDKNYEHKSFYIDIAAVDDVNNIYLLTLTDITKIAVGKFTAEHKAYTDGLTGIYNRNKFEESFYMELDKIKRHNVPLSIALLDIDKFKNFNDTYGHLIGDEVLIMLCNSVLKNIRKSDMFARWGGEEFIIMFYNTDAQNAVNISNNLREKIKQLNHKTAGKITASFGVTQYKEDDTLKTIFKRCDDALYIAKENGRDRVEVL